MTERLQKIFKTGLLVTTFGFFLLACSKENKVQQLPFSIQQLIDSNINCGCSPYIDEYKWKNKTTYVWSCRGPACDCIVFYYDETGKQFTLDSTYSFDKFLQESKLIKNVWSCHP